MLGMHMGRVPAPSAREESGEIHRLDTYDWLQMINRASIVSNVEEGILEKPLARRILTALNTLRDKAAKPNAVRPGLYITFEPEVLKLVGMEASVLHVGRSSQDILATANAGLNIARLMPRGRCARAGVYERCPSSAYALFPLSFGSASGLHARCGPDLRMHPPLRCLAYGGLRLQWYGVAVKC